MRGIDDSGGRTPSEPVVVVVDVDHGSRDRARKVLRQGGVGSAITGSDQRAAEALLDFAITGTLQIRRGSEALFGSSEDSEGLQGAAVLRALIGLKRAVELCVIEGPQALIFGSDWLELSVVNDERHGVWINGDRSMRASANEWDSAFNAGLEEVKKWLSSEVPEVFANEIFGPWLRGEARFKLSYDITAPWAS